MRFRNKPVVIEAFRVSQLLYAAEDNWAALPPQVRAAYDAGKIVFLPHGMVIHTPEGTLVTAREDWLIIGIRGEMYPCKPNIFNETYESVDAEEQRT